MSTSIDRLARELLDLKRTVRKIATQPRLAFSSIDGGFLQVNDDDGLTRTIIGAQEDGTVTVVDLNGPPPPIPLQPTATGVEGGVSISSYGLTADGSAWPLDFRAIEIHVGLTSGFIPSAASKMGEFSRDGGQLTVAAEPGTYYVVLVAVNTSGVSSLPSTQVSATALAISAATPSTPPTPTAPTVVGGIGNLYVRWTAVVHDNPVIYEVHVSDTSGFTPGPTTMTQQISGTAATVKRLPIPDGIGNPETILSYGVTYYVKIIAKDTIDLSYASAASPEASGAPVQATGADIAADTVTTTNLVAGSVTGEVLAGEILLGSKIRTADTGQRVEMDTAGVRLFAADESLLVDLPTDSASSPIFRGEIQADGLTVRQGATFESPLNEFARESVISLAEQLSSPPAAPTVAVEWETVSLAQESATGPLGTFSLIPSEISAVGFDDSAQHIVIAQARGGGSRLWFYNMNGTRYNFVADWEDFRIVGCQYTGPNQPLILAEWLSGGGFYLWHAAVSGAWKRYFRSNANLDPGLGWNGTDVIIAETKAADNYPRFRVIDDSTSTLVYASEYEATSGPTATKPPAFVYKGNADFGSSKWIIGFSEGITAYRVYSTASGYESSNSFDTPVTRRGGFWNPTTSKFYTVGTDARLYTHTGLTWTSSSDDTWHVAESFYDSNATGGTHETTVGEVRSFTMTKRARVRFTMVQVPYTGNTDDPDKWRLYAKRGPAPASDRSDMKWQADGAYNVTSYLMETAPATTGASPPVTGNFPNATPAVLRSGRSDTVGALLQLKGDGTGRWLYLEDLLCPVGTMVMYVSNTPPTGWVICDGQALSRTTYARLFAIITTQYGVGDGSTTFNVPDMRARIPVGRKATDAVVGNLGSYEQGNAGFVAPGAGDSARLDHRHTHTSGTASTTATGGTAVRVNDPVSDSQGVGGTGVNQRYHAFLGVNYIIRTGL